ncbi:hypothetical protein PAHAL_9G053200 [Panicum hallii]|uniref:Piwi domain-containing protein n=3 Tax=Panicum hallii TaxID=206008 RepID=A0A2T8I089_9POAL|nr:hypothetical protein PAHAL_9G053200 [Panicum hallii]
MAYRGGGRGGRGDRGDQQRPPYSGGGRGSPGFVWPPPPSTPRPVPVQYQVPVGYRAPMVLPHQAAYGAPAAVYWAPAPSGPSVSFSPAPRAVAVTIRAPPPSASAAPAPAPSAAALAKEVEKKLFVSETALALPAAAAAAAAQGAAASDAEDASDVDLAPVSKKGLAHPARPGVGTVGKNVKVLANQFLVDVADNNLFHYDIGGRNTVLERAFVRNGIPFEVPTIIFGADFTHPPPGEDSASSIAAVVASMDWLEITKYRGLVSAQPHRQEIIEDLFTVSKDPQKGHNVNGGMIRELLIAFRRKTNRRPERIIFYRDGVSEGQFSHVLLHEMDAIRKACASLEEGYLPPVTFVVVQKRHHTRLFPEVHGRRDMTDKSGNILPGTVVDQRICHPTEFDFYICSHPGIQVAINPEPKSRATNREVLNELIKLHRKSTLGGKLPAYDGRKSLYTAGSLPFDSEEFMVTLVDPEKEKERVEREYKITIRIAERTDMYHLHQFLRGRQRDMPQETRQVLDVVLRESPSWNYVTVSRSFFSTTFGHRGDIGEGLECWRGYYQSLRPTQMGLSLNIDISATSVFKPVTVIKFVEEFLSIRDTSRPLSDRDRVKIKKALRRVCIETNHQQDQIRRCKITGVTPMPMSQLMFGVSTKVEEHIHRNIATFLVKVEGTSISVRQNLSTTTIKMLVEHACDKRGIRNYDGYPVFLGKVLDDTKLLSDCKVCNNCIVEVRGRGRAGRERRIKCTTFDDEMKDIDLFSVVSPLSKTLTNTKTQEKSATFLSGQAKWYGRQVFISLCRMHFRKKSLDGKFNASHILFHDGRVVFDESCMEVDFTGHSCKNDYGVIAEIFKKWFCIPDEAEEEGRYPLFVADLIDYLLDCPLGEKSNSAAAIAFLVNHPALTTFMDRIGQCTTLDSMVDRLTEFQKFEFDEAVGSYNDWSERVEDVPAMYDTLVYDPFRRVDAPEETLYTENLRSCLKFARNHFRHARPDLSLERVEASFSLNLVDFLPMILQAIVKSFEGPPAFDMVTLLGDHVADRKCKRDVDAENPAKVIASPSKKPKISFSLKGK